MQRRSLLLTNMGEQEGGVPHKGTSRVECAGSVEIPSLVYHHTPPLIDTRSIVSDKNSTFDEISLGEACEDSAAEDMTNNNISLKSYKKSEGEKKESDPSKAQDVDPQTTKDDTKHGSVPFYRLFRFSTLRERLLVGVGILAAVIGGCSMPFMIILFGQLANSFVSQAQVPENNSTSLGPCYDVSGEFNIALPDCDFDPEELEADKDVFYVEITKFAQGSAIIGLVNLICSYLFVTCLNYTAELQVFRIRNLFLRAVLRQDIAWYDIRQNGDFASRTTDDLNKLQEGIGEKIGMFIFFITIFVASLINAFIHGWELTLVILGAMPVLIVAITILAGCQAALTEREMTAYGKAGSIAEEVLSAVRTVVAFGGEEREVDRYDKKLVHARRAGILRGTLTAIGAGVMWFIIYSSYALAFWYGVKLIMEDRDTCAENIEDCHPRYTPSSLLIVFFSVLMGAMNLGQASPYVEAFSVAKGSASVVFGIIDRQPIIDSSSTAGVRPTQLKGRIDFRDVAFNYPARKNVPILKGLSLVVEPGKTMALVGPSGCGKSTVIQLVQRFYDPDHGSVVLDGLDLKNVNIGWLRDQIGVVGQEPVLFGTSIGDNIRFGREGVSDEEVESACRAANAWRFIQKLPRRLHTLVGDKGAQLSGGQKQRIAIARAIVRNPKILLLDEATSALDSASEACVQAALDRAKTGRTTIVVAHRLSTVRSADKIVAIRDGEVVEEGTHDQLMLAEGLYHSLVTTQMNKKEEEEEEVVDDEDLDGAEDRAVDNTNESICVSPTMADEAHTEDNNTQQQPNSLLSIGSSTFSAPFSGGMRRTLDRKISVMSNYSTYSEDSLGLESALEAASAAVGIARVGASMRSSRRSKKSVVRQDSEAVAMSTVTGGGGVVAAPCPAVEEVEEQLVKVDSVRIMKMQLQDWPYISVGILGSIVMGAAMPVYAILFGEVLGVLRLPSDQARHESIYYCGMFVVTGVVAGIAIFLQICMFTIAGEQLTQRMRRSAFAAMLRQEMGWFDRPENSVGALLSRLSADSSAIQGATGSRIGAILHAAFTLIISITTSLVLEWRLGLIGSLFVPLVLVGTIMQFKVISGQDTVENTAMQTASKLAIEAITNIRTVAGLRKESYFIEAYNRELSGPHEVSKRRSHVRGAIFGFSQSVPFFAYSGCMFYGGYLVYSEGIEYKKVFKVAEALILGTMMVGQASAFAPNYTKAMIAAARVFNLIDRKPEIDTAAGSGLRLNKVDGEVELRGATFNYPNRRQVRVLRGLNLCITAGQSVALVGPSGCGKSTCVQLLQRFYNLNDGDLTLENHDIQSLNVPWIRSKMSIVSQEPVLFNRSLAENIAYGDNTKEVTMEEVIAAARKANIHQFITNLPQGYETNVGEKGTQLSGGQKQRIAIARALVRNPPILLLDEATSALDSESEKMVQSALESAQRGRTSITIAHRLSTIKNCDRIFVVNHGRVVESGTHDELLNSQGTYHKLWTTQAGAPPPSRRVGGVVVRSSNTPTLSDRKKCPNRQPSN